MLLQVFCGFIKRSTFYVQLADCILLVSIAIVLYALHRSWPLHMEGVLKKLEKQFKYKGYIYYSYVSSFYLVSQYNVLTSKVSTYYGFRRSCRLFTKMTCRAIEGAKVAIVPELWCLKAPRRPSATEEDTSFTNG